MQRNLTIREQAKACDIKLWMVADVLGITDASFSRKLRYEPPADEQKRIVEIIHNLAQEASTIDDK